MHCKPRSMGDSTPQHEFSWLYQSQLPQTLQRFPQAPGSLCCLAFMENEFVVSSEAVISSHDVSARHTGRPDSEASFVVYLLQLLCCWSCLHSHVHRAAMLERAENSPADEEVGWMLADCNTEQPQSRISVSNGTRW